MRAAEEREGNFTVTRYSAGLRTHPGAKRPVPIILALVGVLILAFGSVYVSTVATALRELRDRQQLTDLAERAMAGELSADELRNEAGRQGLLTRIWPESAAVSSGKKPENVEVTIYPKHNSKNFGSYSIFYIVTYKRNVAVRYLVIFHAYLV